jgi:hypothetical protein
VTIREIFTEAERLGVTLIADGNTIRARPKNVISMSLVRAIQDRKTEVLLELRIRALAAAAQAANCDLVEYLEQHAPELLEPENRYPAWKRYPAWEPGEVVMRVIDPAALFQSFKFGRCACGQPATIVVQRDVFFDDRQSFCIDCLKKRRQEGANNVRA